MKTGLLYEDLTGEIIGGGIEVHKALGPGLLESVYEEFLCYELELRGIPDERQVYLPATYKGRRVPRSFRYDILVNGLVIVEIKAVEKLTPLDEAILLTYLKLSGKRVGMLMNFNVPVLPQGIVRRVV